MQQSAAKKGQIMSYQQKLDTALAFLKEHNEAIGEASPGTPNPGYVNPLELISCIKAQGATKDELLSSLSHEDILECLPAVNGIKPRIIAKQLAKIFRGKEETAEKDSTGKNVSSKKAANMSVKELIDALDPEEPTSPVADRLKKMTNGQPFIVYSSGRIVDTAVTFKLVTELRQGFPPVKSILVDGNPKEVFALGELPENYADENPLFHDRPLRPDGTCDQTSRSWEGVPQVVRQLVYIAVENGEIDVTAKNGIMLAHDIINIAVSSDAEKKFRQMHQKVALEFDKLAKTGDLPTLKIALGQKAGGGSPFDGGQKVEWAPAFNGLSNYQKRPNYYQSKPAVGQWTQWDR